MEGFEQRGKCAVLVVKSYGRCYIAYCDMRYANYWIRLTKYLQPTGKGWKTSYNIRCLMVFWGLGEEFWEKEKGLQIVKIRVLFNFYFIDFSLVLSGGGSEVRTLFWVKCLPCIGFPRPTKS